MLLFVSNNNCYFKLQLSGYCFAMVGFTSAIFIHSFIFTVCFQLDSIVSVLCPSFNCVLGMMSDFHFIFWTFCVLCCETYNYISSFLVVSQSPCLRVVPGLGRVGVQLPARHCWSTSVVQQWLPPPPSRWMGC